jgi:hypothetical protein
MYSLTIKEGVALTFKSQYFRSTAISEAVSSTVTFVLCSFFGGVEDKSFLVIFKYIGCRFRG